MKIDQATILQRGDESGNGMVVKYRLGSGLEILGLPTMNFYGGHWDLGPTWNWLVLADRPFLVDAGRSGQGADLVRMIESFGPSPSDLDFVLVSHGHEDHDGGLAELLASARLEVKAHEVYTRLIRAYPGQGPDDHRGEFPAKCWHCFMPESFWGKHCLEYHRLLGGLRVDPLLDGRSSVAPDVSAIHLPGHSPDCLAVMLGEEAIVLGDIVLAGITPWPTMEENHAEVAGILGAGRSQPEELFGLRRYVRSLKELAQIGRDHPDILPLPAHRVYYHDQWNPFSLTDRVEEILDHHRARCGAILKILADGPRNADEIAAAHFSPDQLKGYGHLMARTEVVSHCELLTASGDVRNLGDHRYERVGGEGYRSVV